MKLILYGLGTGSQFIEDKLKPNQEIVGYTDSKSLIKYYNGKKFFRLEQLNTIEFDYIIICVRNAEANTAIEHLLKNKYMIDNHKIIKIYPAYYKMKKYPKVLQMLDSNGFDYKYQGIVLGLSYSYFGIRSDKLTKKVCNLSLPTQDLSHDKMVLKYAIENHEEKFKGLKYAIIDLFDYHILNYDLNKTKNKMIYLKTRGFTDDYSDLTENEIEQIEDMGIGDRNPNNQGIIADLFEELNDEYQIIEQPSATEYLSGLTDEDVNADFTIPKAYRKVYCETIEQNKKYLSDMIHILKNCNENIKIYFVMMPRYYLRHQCICQYDETAMWKNMIEDEMKKLKSTYSNIYYLDFKEYLPITTNKDFFHDPAHLSYTGAVAFTSIMDEIVEERIRCEGVITEEEIY